MKVLITGSEGKLGTMIIKQLQKKQYEVVGLDMVSQRSGRDYRFYQGSLPDDALLDKAMEGIDVVIHLAGIPIENYQWNDILTANVMGTMGVMLSAQKHGVRRFVLASSICAYGFMCWSKRTTPKYFPIDEKFPLSPDFPYGLSKEFDERLCQAFSSRFDMETVSLRLAAIWFQEFPEYTRPFMECLKDPGAGADQLWSYVDAQDAAQAFELAVSSPLPRKDCVYNIGAENILGQVPAMELVRKYYGDVAEIKNPVQYQENPFTALFSIGKAKKELGYAPKHDWREYDSL